MKRSSHKLDFTPSFDFIILGIVCSDQESKVIWAINNELEMLFKRNGTISIQNQKQGDVCEFSLSTFNDENNFLKYNLIRNKSEDVFFIPELKNVDYFIQIIGDMNDSQLQKRIQNFQAMSIVSGVLKITPDNLKSKHHFLF